MAIHPPRLKTSGISCRFYLKNYFTLSSSSSTAFFAAANVYFMLTEFTNSLYSINSLNCSLHSIPSSLISAASALRSILCSSSRGYRCVITSSFTASGKRASDTSYTSYSYSVSSSSCPSSLMVVTSLSRSLQ